MNTAPSVALFVPCLADQIYPEIAIATYHVLKALGVEVEYIRQARCCGQPAFNAGHVAEACEVASHCLETFEPYPEIVCPSGSCTAMIRVFYPELFEGRAESLRAEQAGERTFELTEFLFKHELVDAICGEASGKVGYHISCHSCRELQIKDDPMRILRRIKGCELLEIPGSPVCCGFGGLFSFKFDTVAAAMARSRLEMFTALGATIIVSNDPGCIMHLRNQAERDNLEVEILHIAQFISRAMSLPQDLNDAH